MNFSVIFGGGGKKASEPAPSDASDTSAATQKIEQLIVDILITKRRLDHLLSNLQARDKSLLKRMSDVQETGDEFKLHGLARELLQIRKIANMAVYSSYMLEVVRLRLDTMRFVSTEVVPTLRIVRPLLSEVRGLIRSVSPGSELTIEDIENDLLDIMAKTGAPEVPQMERPEVTDKEVKRILSDVHKMAAERISQSFPEVPELNEVVENTVFEYVKAHSDSFDLSTAERDLPLSKVQIVSALRSLGSKGKINIEQGTEEQEIT